MTMDGSDPLDRDDDAALRYAIALSLQDAKGETIELSSDDDEDDLDKPPVYRPQPPKNGQSASLSTGSALVPTPQPSSQPALRGLAGLGFDRKKMEEERLARLGKRKAPDSEQEIQQGRQKPKLGHASSANNMVTSNQPTTATANGLPFPRGVVKKTWSYGYPRTGDEIKIEEVLQKNQLELAVLSSFQWDDEWMMSKIDIKRTKIICIAYASSKEQQEEMEANVPKGAIRFCFPPMLPFGNMHSKLQLLRYPKYLRIVVPSGNLVSYDWGETGIMENIVFIIDLPRIEDPDARAANRLTMFGEDLCYFLRAQGLDESLVNSLENYDFSETSRYAFVHTIGTSHVDDSWKRTGYCGLGRAVTALGFGTSGDIEIDLVVSSLGSINKDLITAICYAAQGDDGLKELRERVAKTSKSKAGASTTSSPWSCFRDKLRIYFPSEDTILQSRGGKNNGGTICAQSKWWDAATFPRELIHDCKSVRDGMLMHNKIMLVSPRGFGKAWGYVGSHNLSESAWGRLIKEKKSGKPKLTCRNWECGVLVPAGEKGASTSDEVTNSHDISVFAGAIPVPMIVPGEPYGKTESRRPWLFLES